MNQDSVTLYLNPIEVSYFGIRKGFGFILPMPTKEQLDSIVIKDGFRISVGLDSMQEGYIRERLRGEGRSIPCMVIGETSVPSLSNGGVYFDHCPVSSYRIINIKSFLQVFVDRFGLGAMETVARGWDSWVFGDRHLRSEFNKLKAKIRKERVREWVDIGKLYIPDIGWEFKLKEDFEFKAERERRQKILELFSVEVGDWRRTGETYNVVLRAGSILKVDRVYIRKGSEDFSSVTFFFTGELSHLGKGYEVKKARRFWMKLEDVNKLVVLINKNNMRNGE